MREGRCISLIERLKQGSELKSTLSIGKLFQRFMTRSVKKLDLTEPTVPPHNIWVPSKISRVLTTPTATFAKIFNGILFRSIL